MGSEHIIISDVEAFAYIFSVVAGVWLLLTN